MNSGPRPCLVDVGFPLSGPRVRTSTSDLKRHAQHTALRARLRDDRRATQPPGADDLESSSNWAGVATTARTQGTLSGQRLSAVQPGPWRLAGRSSTVRVGPCIRSGGGAAATPRRHGSYSPRGCERRADTLYATRVGASVMLTGRNPPAVAGVPWWILFGQPSRHARRPFLRVGGQSASRRRCPSRNQIRARLAHDPITDSIAGVGTAGSRLKQSP